MAQSTDEECGICLDALSNPVALPCSHKFCSNCLDSWRSKYGAQGDMEKVGRACPLCRKKIPPSKEMLAQLECMRKMKNIIERRGGTLSEDYMKAVHGIERLEKEVGDWTEAEALDYGEDNEYLVLPEYIVNAIPLKDTQTILDWLGPPPVDKKRVDARAPDMMNITLLFYAAAARNSGLLSILLQFGADVNAVTARGSTTLTAGTEPEDYQQARLLLEWGAEVKPQHFGAATKEEVISWVLEKGNVKLANLLKSELGGRRCELINFTKSPELNGKACVVDKYLPDKGRYKIEFEGSGQKALVPPLNLKRRDRTPTDCGHYITFENGRYSRRDFASKEECQAYVAELEAKHAAEKLAGLNIDSSGSTQVWRA